jgi:hypothetical protein
MAEGVVAGVVGHKVRQFPAARFPDDENSRRPRFPTDEKSQRMPESAGTFHPLENTARRIKLTGWCSGERAVIAAL